MKWNFLIIFVLHQKCPRRTKSERRDDRVFTELFFIIAMKSHTVILIPIKVQKNRIERRISTIFYPSFDFTKQIGPRQRVHRYARIIVLLSRVAIKSDEPWLFMFLTINSYVFLSPLSLIIELTHDRIVTDRHFDFVQN